MSRLYGAAYRSRKARKKGHFWYCSSIFSTPLMRLSFGFISKPIWNLAISHTKTVSVVGSYAANSTSSTLWRAL